MKSITAHKKIFVLIFALLFNIVAPYFLGGIGKVNAAQLTEASIRLTRMSASVAASASNPILVVVKPATTATEATVKLTIPDSTSNAFTVSTTASDFTTTTTGIPSTYQGETLTAWPTIGSPASSSSDGGASTVVTFSSGDLTPGTLYGFYITGGITNPTTGNAGTKIIGIATQATGPVVIDSNDVAVDVTATNADQVTLYATVSATFNFALSANTMSMDALSTSARAYGEVTVDIDTNAGNGWAAWMRSEGGAATLASAATGDSISSTNTGSPVTASIGSKGYVVDVGVTNGTGAGTPNVTTEYDGGTDDAANGSSTAGGVISTTYEEIANSDGPGSDDGITLESVVTISAVTEAGSDYTDTWEVVGAGNF